MIIIRIMILLYNVYNKVYSAVVSSVTLNAQAQAEIIQIDCQCFYYSYIYFCCYGFSCGVLSAIHLDLGCTHMRPSDPCLSTIGPKVQFFSQV